jgi:hypothetical protein
VGVQERSCVAGSEVGLVIFLDVQKVGLGSLQTPELLLVKWVGMAPEGVQVGNVVER